MRVKRQNQDAGTIPPLAPRCWWPPQGASPGPNLAAYRRSFERVGGDDPVGEPRASRKPSLST